MGGVFERDIMDLTIIIMMIKSPRLIGVTPVITPARPVGVARVAEIRDQVNRSACLVRLMTWYPSRT